MKVNQSEEQPSASMFEYLGRNEKWLRPAAVTLMAAGAPALVAIADPTLAASIPSRIVPTVAVVGFFGVGLGAALTDTASAVLARIVGFGASAGILLATIFG